MERVLAPKGFGMLMPYMVRDILLVASAYDCFILEEDGRFSDRMLEQYVHMELSSPPHFLHVTTGREALELLRRRRFDLVLCTPHFAGMSPARLASKIKERHKDLPVVLLTHDRAESLLYTHDELGRHLDQVFLWAGDPKLLVALVKSVEDAQNAAHDTTTCMVRVILVVEDDPSFYSAFLPELYSETLAQCNSLIPDRLNERDRRFRMRARPKILLARNYEDASALFRKYKNNLLGIFCDMRFPRRGRVDPRSGIIFIRKVHRTFPDLPVLLNSWEQAHVESARELKVQFANKADETLSRQVRDFIKRNFGFGPFLFRLPGGAVIDHADNFAEMSEVLKRVSGESLLYHAERNHFSNWLMARSEFMLASQLQPLKVAEFSDMEALRNFLLEALTSNVESRQRGQVTDLPESASLLSRDFIRIGAGSMGGKARGSAFLAHLLANQSLVEYFPEITISVPRTAVICADYYDRFCDQNQLRERALTASSDEEVAEMFMGQELPPDLMKSLQRVVEQIHYPLAVRSSSLLEDVTIQPLAGLYDTYMLPNNHPDLTTRLNRLSRAIRLVMASAFFREARRHLKAHNFRPEREKMAVMVQRVVGSQHDHYFYPDFAGVAQSHNYYPLRFLKPEDGIATVALGFGHTVVEGRRSLRFSPAHPQILPQMGTTQGALHSSQRDFYALDLRSAEQDKHRETGLSMSLLNLADAKEHGTLEAVGATFSPENNMIYDTIYRQGPNVVNFAGVLKFDRFPLGPLLVQVLNLCEEAMGAPVEVEFAVTLNKGNAEMALLELRPLAGVGHETVNLKPFLHSPQLLGRGTALGNGIVDDIYDIIYIHPDRLKLSQSKKLVSEIERFNFMLSQQKRPYLLLGPGRWGTTDPWMGIPVVWSQISGARAIVELELTNSNIEPSLGTHFFHNLATLGVGYFCMRSGKGKRKANFNINWLEQLPVVEEVDGIRHVRLEHPLDLRIDGRIGEGVIMAGNLPAED